MSDVQGFARIATTAELAGLVLTALVGLVLLSGIADAARAARLSRRKRALQIRDLRTEIVATLIHCHLAYLDLADRLRALQFDARLLSDGPSVDECRQMIVDNLRQRNGLFALREQMAKDYPSDAGDALETREALRFIHANLVTGHDASKVLARGEQFIVMIRKRLDAKASGLARQDVNKPAGGALSTRPAG